MLKRDPIKYIRDACKSAYEKECSCRICASTELLEFHHYYSMTALLKRWLVKNTLSMNTEEEVEANKYEFIEKHYDQIYNRTVTLCKPCHLRLHKLYGKMPGLGTAEKQERWVERMRDVV